MSSQKRKFEALSPGDDYHNAKRLCIGERPASLGGDSKNASDDGSSSPLSEVPSESVPTQLAYNILEAKREASENDFGDDHHAYALSELRKAVRRLESINANELLDHEAVRYLDGKLRETIDRKRRNTPPTSVPSYTYSKTLQGCSFPTASRTSSGSEAGPTLDEDHYTRTHGPRSDSNLDQANPPYLETATTSLATRTMEAAASYVEASTQVADVSSLLLYTEAATQTMPSLPASPPYAEAYTQTRRSSAASSDTELWERQLENIRRESPLAPAGAREIVVKCLLRESQDTGSVAAPSAISKATSVSRAAADTPRSPVKSQSTNSQQLRRQHDKPAPVVIDLLSSEDEDKDDEHTTQPPRIVIRRNSRVHVGGGGTLHGFDEREQGNFQGELSSSPPDRRASEQRRDDSRGQHLAQIRPRAASGLASLHSTDNNDMPGYGYNEGALAPIAIRTTSKTANDAELDEWQTQQQQQHRQRRQVALEDFYGLDRGAAGTGRGRIALRYQDARRSEGYTALPSPATGHQLRLRRYLEDSGATHRRDVGAEIAHVLERTSWGVSAGLDEAAVEARWRSSSLGGEEGAGGGGSGGDTYLLRGFPLVERVRFLAPANRGEPSGDCYWRAVAAHMYGGDAEGHWDLVKAEHLGLVYHVLASGPGHPRHALYADHLNARFFDTASSALAAGADGVPGGDGGGWGGVSFKANLWQVLHLAHAWTPALMQQVTADLYGVCLVTFSIALRRRASSSSGAVGAARKEVVVTETTMRGPYNARHIFLLYDSNSNHFQPLLPADYIASEFQYPRPTTAATARYSFAPRARGAGDGAGRGRRGTATKHAWRREFTPTVPPPIPRLHGCHIDQLRGLMGSRPRS